MVATTSFCPSVMFILLPTVFYSKASPAPKLYQSPIPFNTNKPAASRVSSLTPIDIFLRQLAAANLRKNASLNGLAADNVNVMLHQRPFWVLSAGRPSVKIFGEGTESRFPPFLEFFLQRIQSFFSVYRYEDTSRPDPGSYIHDVEMINPTIVTLPQTTIQKEGMDTVLELSPSSGVNQSDYDEEIFADGVGIISIGPNT